MCCVIVTGDSQDIVIKKEYHLHITYTIQIVNNRTINTVGHDELPSSALEMAQGPCEMGCINISASHTTLDQTLNTTADHRDCYV